MPIKSTLFLWLNRGLPIKSTLFGFNWTRPPIGFIGQLSLFPFCHNRPIVSYGSRFAVDYLTGQRVTFCLSNLHFFFNWILTGQLSPHWKHARVRANNSPRNATVKSSFGQSQGREDFELRPPAAIKDNSVSTWFEGLAAQPRFTIAKSPDLWPTTPL